jgi:transcription initiation factor TFIIIB Brf1 subunit/transcription initiation factor TFIIB
MLMPPSVTEIRRPTTHEDEIQKDAHAIRAVREQANMRTLADFSVFFRLLMTYRVPMMVDEAIIYRKAFTDDLYYRCPRCQTFLARDFMAYCDRCGQCLDWREYRKAKRTYRTPTR